MTVNDAVEFFQHIPKIQRKLQTIKDVGLIMDIGATCYHPFWEKLSV